MKLVSHMNVKFYISLFALATSLVFTQVSQASSAASSIRQQQAQTGNSDTNVKPAAKAVTKPSSSADLIRKIYQDETSGKSVTPQKNTENSFSDSRSFSKVVSSNQIANSSAKIPEGVVQPVLFFPSDKDVTIGSQYQYSESDIAHLDKSIKIVQDRFAVLLSGKSYSETLHNSFRLNAPIKYISKNNHAYFVEGVKFVPPEDSNIKYDKPDHFHRIAAELLANEGSDRKSSKTVFVVIYMRPKDQNNFATQAQTFNGAPNTGGGLALFDVYELKERSNFLSTLLHEMGHTFGLAHVAAYNLDMKTNRSIMSYKPENESKDRFSLGPAQGGTLIAEDYYRIGLNKMFFPNFSYVNAVNFHNPEQRTVNTFVMNSPMRDLDFLPAIQNQEIARSNVSIPTTSISLQIEKNTAFVTQAFKDILKRQPDNDGLNFYTNQLKFGKTESQITEDIKASAEAKCINVGGQFLQGSCRCASGQIYKGDTCVANEIAGTDKVENYKNVVSALYEQHLNRKADSGGLSFYVDQLKFGKTAEEIGQSLKSSVEGQCVSGGGRFENGQCVKSQVLASTSAGSGKSCYFQGGKLNEAESCVYGSAATSHGGTGIAFVLSGGSGQATGKCENGEWINIQTQCSSSSSSRDVAQSNPTVTAVTTSSNPSAVPVSVGPTGLPFVSVSNAGTNTAINSNSGGSNFTSSNEVTISGLASEGEVISFSSTSAQINGQPNCSFVVNGGPRYGPHKTDYVIKNGDRLKFDCLNPDSFGSVLSVSYSVGTKYSGGWSLAAMSDPGTKPNIAFFSNTSVNLGVAALSDPLTISGLGSGIQIEVYVADIGPGVELSVNGVWDKGSTIRYVKNGDRVQMRYTPTVRDVYRRPTLWFPPMSGSNNSQPTTASWSVVAN